MRTGRAIMSGTIVVTTLLAMAACGGGGGSGSSADQSQLSGTGQKGPFQPGGTATATRLAPDGTLASDTVTGEIGADGDYDLPALSWTGATRIALEGGYYNEVDGTFSSASRRLEAVVLADGDPDANVNVFTHILAARVRSLMGNGASAAEALAQARGEIRSLLGITANPSALDLLEAAANPDPADGASLLLFSASVLKAGLDQQGLDDLAADFADDGQINGAGAGAYQDIQQAANDDTLLDTARRNLQNQYGETPPDLGGDAGLAWKLAPCEALALTESRVVCDDRAFFGTGSLDSREFVAFVPAVTGHYTIELFDDPDASDANTGSCSYTVYGDASTSSTEYGDSGATDGFCGIEDVTDLRLTGGETYYILPSVSKADDPGPDPRFRLSVNRVSEGKEFAAGAIEVGIGSPRAATVGTLINTSDESYYRFTAGMGTHRITVSGYPCGDGQLELELFGGVDSSGFTDSIAEASAPDACSQTLEADLAPDREYYLTVVNRLGGFNRRTFRPAPGGIDFELLVARP